MYYIKLKSTGQIIFSSSDKEFRDESFKTSFMFHLSMGGRLDNVPVEKDEDEIVSIIDSLPSSVPATSDEDIAIMNNAEYERSPLDWDEEMKDYRKEFHNKPPKLI